MKTVRHFPYLMALVLLVGVSGCDFLFGSKEDEVVDEIFEQGAIPPDLGSAEVGYVPILPFWEDFQNPVDVYVGYDAMVYVVDDNGLNILDQAGRRFRTIPIPGAVEVVQDRRLHTYVAGRASVEVDGVDRDLAAVYRIVNASSGGEPQIVDTILQYFDDNSRVITAFRGANDEACQFTGLGTLADNTLYVARRGPVNSLVSIAWPDNTVLIYDEDGNNLSHSNGLSPVSSNLRSTWDLSALATFAAPPQTLSGISGSRDFMHTLTAPAAEFKALWIIYTEDPAAGIIYQENSSLLIQDPDQADRFLYEPARFERPEDIYIAPDATGYIFIVDAALDSLYQFTQKGLEGVNPPANSTATKQILASFGGPGAGQFQFDEPSGVCYYREMVYVADKGNGRIARYKLSTDLE